MRIALLLVTILTFIIVWIPQSLAEKKEDKIDEDVLKESVKEFDPKIIPKKMGQNMLKMRKCYINERKKNKGIGEGKIIINFTIDLNGESKNINIKSSEVKNKKVESCLMNVIAKTTFPQPPSVPIDVNYPLHFNKEKEEGKNIKQEKENKKELKDEN